MYHFVIYVDNADTGGLSTVWSDNQSVLTSSQAMGIEIIKLHENRDSVIEMF